MDNAGILAGLSALLGGVLVTIVSFFLRRGHTKFTEDLAVRKELRSEAERLGKEVERLGKELQSLRLENNSTRREYWTLVSSNSKLELKAKTQEIEIEKLGRELTKAQVELDSVNKELDICNAKLELRE